MNRKPKIDTTAEITPADAGIAAARHEAQTIRDTKAQTIPQIAIAAGFETIDAPGEGGTVYERTLPNGDYLSIRDANTDNDDNDEPDTHARVGRYDKHGSAVKGHYQEGSIVAVSSLAEWIAGQIGEQQ